MVAYFNNWFSSIGSVIADLKERRGDNIKIIASSHNPYHVMKNYADEFYVEDWEGNGTFIDWLMPFLKEKRPDVFFVKKWTEEVLEKKEEIETLGVKLIAEDLDIYKLTDDKAGTYKKLAGVTRIPEYINTDNLLDIQTFLQKRNICLKLNHGEGGESFKRIVDEKKTLMDFTEGRHNEATLNEVAYFAIKASPEDRKKFIFMEYLSGPEISADCYNSKNGFICVARSKNSGTRAEKLFCNEEISAECEKIGNALSLKYPFNVQFRLKEGTNQKDFSNYRLLEVNPRISGGMYYEVYAGLNICDVCLCDIVGGNWYNISDYTMMKEKIMSHIETPVIIQ